MKQTILLLTISLATGLHMSGQTTTGSPNLGAAASPANLGLSGFNNSFGAFFGNQAPSGITTGTLNQLLLNLQVDLAQMLPVVSTINDSFDFTSVGTNAAFGSVGITNTSALSTSSVANLGTSLGQDPSGTSVTQGSTALGGAAPAITPIIGSNATATGASGAVAQGSLFTSRREVLRALLLLQDDVEKMLPLVNALNGGNAGTLHAVFTNSLPSLR